MSAYGQLRVHPACPVRGHVERVTCVGFLSPDGTKVVSAASDLTVKIWDGDTGELLRSMHGSRFSLDGERVVSSLVDPPRPRTSGCHIVTSCRDELSVFAEKVAESGEEEGAGPVACFVASGEVTALHCHGAAICVGCSDGSLLLLQAPFLAAGVVRA
ncbi:hypothetical protein T484DRAFT_2708692 [Baffinella frigidus]|nr:hypothetical protein T484DRAFT_2708692 [Cryptophyta sp. CCMP2293]